MAYSEQILRRAQARLAQAKQEHDDEQQARIAAIYQAYPRLQELDKALKRTMAQTMAACFQKGEDPQGAIAKIKEENLALQHERDWILQAAELDEQELSAGAHLPRLRRHRLCGRADVRVSHGAVPSGAEKGTLQSARRRPGEL